MPQKKKKATPVTKLRQRAEKALKEASIDNADPVIFPPDEMNGLIHELQIHQIELEMQNEELRIAHAELETERARYFDLYNLAPVGFFSINEQKLIFECNLTAAKILGKNRTDIINQSITRFILEEDQDIFYLHNKQSFEAHIPQGCDLRMLKSDRSAFWVHLETIVEQKAEGVTVNRLVISDITKRKLAEKSLKESEERYHRIVELSPDLVAIHLNARIIYINKTGANMLGCSNPEQLIGKSFLDYLPSRENEIARGRIKKLLHANRRSPVYDQTIIRPDGTELCVEVVGIPFNYKGETAIQIDAKDVTIQKKAETKLKQSEQNLIEAQAIAKVGSWQYDIENNISTWSNEMFRLFDRDKELGEPTWEEHKTSIHPDDWEKIDKAVQSAICDATSYQEEFRILFGDGSIRWAETKGKVQKKEDGFIHKLSGTVQEITERKKIQGLLQKANDALKQKASTLEDMNTALNVLLNKRDQDAQVVEEKLYCNCEIVILPLLNKLKNSYSNINQQKMINIIETNLKEIVSPFSKKLSDPMTNLTPTEIQIASFIKQGLINKEIAHALNCSVRTIDSHRDNIRKKLNLKNKKINLKSFLMRL